MLRSAARNRKKFNLLELTLNELFWLLMINLLMFESTIQEATGFTYIDEFATMALAFDAILILYGVAHTKMDRLAAMTIACLMLYAFIGVASNCTSGVSVKLKGILIDIFACVKFPVTLLASCVVFQKRARLRDIFLGEIRVLLVVLIVFGVLNLFVPIADFGIDSRYGLRASFRFVFGHPESLNLVTVGLLANLVLDPERNRKWIAVALVVMCLSLRSKALAFVAIAWFLLIVWGKEGRLKWYQIAIGLVGAVLIGYDQFQAYFTTDGSARKELTKVAFNIANRFFPLGSGFATYGSNITADTGYYSPLYYEYRLNLVEGLNYGKVSYLSDVFWPIVIGQFGWLGVVVFCVLLVLLLVFVYRRSGYPGQRLACVLCFLYLLIASSSASAFYHPYAVYLGLCLGLALAAGRPEAQDVPKRSDSIMLGGNPM